MLAFSSWIKVDIALVLLGHGACPSTYGVYAPAVHLIKHNNHVDIVTLGMSSCAMIALEIMCAATRDRKG